jgi:hypothetical protein
MMLYHEQLLALRQKVNAWRIRRNQGYIEAAEGTEVLRKSL